MRSDCDVLVIGGGVVGLCCAYFLRLAGARVTVLERDAIGDAGSCSYGNTGWVGTQGSVPLAEPGVPAQGLRWLLNPRSPFYIKPHWDPALARWLWQFRRACNERDAQAGFGVLLAMKQHTLAILRELCASGPLAGTFSTPGLLVAYRSPQAFAAARRSAPQLAASGIPVRLLDAAQLRELEPGAAFDVCGALLNADGAVLRVPAFLHALAGELAGMGVEIREHAEVTGYQVRGRGIAEVRAGGEALHAGEVVLAAGAWAACSARQLGLRLALQPAKGYTVTVAAPRGAPTRPVLLSEGKVALTPMGDRLRFGGTLELSGMHRGISRQRVAGILDTVRAYLPGLEQTPTLEIWSGLRPCTPDGLPLIGRTGPFRNLTIATGHSHIGMGLAPFTGKLVAQVLAGKPPELDLGPLDPGRFGSVVRHGALRRGR